MHLTHIIKVRRIKKNGKTLLSNVKEVIQVEFRPAQRTIASIINSYDFIKSHMDVKTCLKNTYTL